MSSQLLAMVKFLALTDFQGLILYSSLVLTKISASSPKYRVLHQNNGSPPKYVEVSSSNSLATRRGTRNLIYILAFILLNLHTTSAYSTSTLLLLHLLTSSSIVAVLIAKAGLV